MRPNALSIALYTALVATALCVHALGPASALSLWFAMALAVAFSSTATHSLSRLAPAIGLVALFLAALSVLGRGELLIASYHGALAARPAV
ncbi:MAG: hypothetical protein ACXIUB_01355 [Wenzhouxiangella sp.]